jgi:hypothetical protein
MKYLAIVMLLASCSTYKAYQKVAADPFVDARESVLLAQKCLAVYPFKSDSVRVVRVGDDSAAYQATIDGLISTIDQLSAALDSAGTEVGFIDTNDVSAPVMPRDSLRIIRQFLKSYRIPPVVRTIEKEVPVTDARREALNHAQLVACQAEQAKAVAAAEKASRKLQKKNATMGWVIAGGLEFGLIGFGLGRLKRV